MNNIDFTISLDHPDRPIVPGDRVTGTVQLIVTEPMTSYGIEVRLQSYAQDKQGMVRRRYIVDQYTVEEDAEWTPGTMVHFPFSLLVKRSVWSYKAVLAQVRHEIEVEVRTLTANHAFQKKESLSARLPIQIDMVPSRFQFVEGLIVGPRGQFELRVDLFLFTLVLYFATAVLTAVSVEQVIWRYVAFIAPIVIGLLVFIFLRFRKRGFDLEQVKPLTTAPDAVQYQIHLKARRKTSIEKVVVRLFLKEEMSYSDREGSAFRDVYQAAAEVPLNRTFERNSLISIEPILALPAPLPPVDFAGMTFSWRAEIGVYNRGRPIWHQTTALDTMYADERLPQTD